MFESLVDIAFRRAQEEGALDNLPGAGKPITPASLDADPFAHAFAESGAMTPFGAVQRRIEEARTRLARTTEPEQLRAIQAEIAALETRKAIEMETWKRYG